MASFEVGRFEFPEVISVTEESTRVVIDEGGTEVIMLGALDDEAVSSLLELDSSESEAEEWVLNASERASEMTDSEMMLSSDDCDGIWEDASS